MVKEYDLLVLHKFWRLDSNIKSKSSNNTYLKIIEIFNDLFNKLNIIESQNLITTSDRSQRVKIGSTFLPYYNHAFL